MNKRLYLIECDYFDARRGCTRWSLPGIDSHFSHRRKVSADFWIDRQGRFLVRFRHQKHVDYFQIVVLGAEPATEDEVEAIMEDKMVTWMVEDYEAECVWDDLPEELEYKASHRTRGESDDSTPAG